MAETNVKGNVSKNTRGTPGPIGKAFEYTDFTENQLEALKGDKGEKGDKGDKGEKGDVGPQGEQGPSYDDAKIRDEINIKLYGTTDVHILTNDDVWINGDILEAQKRSIIEYDVVIIPYGISAIMPRSPALDEETWEYYFEDGVFPIDIRAKKIICPNTLVNIFGSANIFDISATHEINIQGDFVLNEGVQIIDLINYDGAYGSSDIGNITVPKTLKTFSVWNYYHDIVIPTNVDKISFYAAEIFSGHLYVYNPDFDFSDFETDASNDNGGGGVIHGYAGSTAETFAKENGYTFKNLGSAGGGADMETIKQYVDEQIGEALEGDY